MINSRSASVVLSSAKTRSSGSLETFVRNICQHYLSELIVRNICQNWLSEIFVRIICEKNVVHYNFQTKLWKCWGWPVSMLWSFCMVRVLFICSLESRTPFESSRVKEEKMRNRSVSVVFNCWFRQEQVSLVSPALQIHSTYPVSSFSSFCCSFKAMKPARDSTLSFSFANSLQTIFVKIFQRFCWNHPPYGTSYLPPRFTE